MNEKNQFGWVNFYKELALKLLEYKDRRDELVEKVKAIYTMTNINMPTLNYSIFKRRFLHHLIVYRYSIPKILLSIIL